MTDDFGEGSRNTEECFPFPEEAYPYIAEIEDLLSRLAVSLTVPDKVAVWAAVIGLRRLPRSTPGLDVEITLTQPESARRDGNWGYAEIRIREDVVELGEGGHVYSPSVGGDSWSHTVFESWLGARHCDGDEFKVENWLGRAKFLADEAEVSIEDGTDYGAVQHVFSELRGK